MLLITDIFDFHLAVTVPSIIIIILLVIIYSDRNRKLPHSKTTEKKNSDKSVAQTASVLAASVSYQNIERSGQKKFIPISTLNTRIEYPKDSSNDDISSGVGNFKKISSNSFYTLFQTNWRRIPFLLKEKIFYNPFYKWIKSNWYRPPFLFGFLIIGLAIFFPIYFKFSSNSVYIDIDTLKPINYIIQIAFITMAIFILWAQFKHFKKDKEKLILKLTAVFDTINDSNKNVQSNLLRLKNVSKDVPKAIDAEQSFIKSFLLFFCSFLALYILLFAQWYFPVDEQKEWYSTLQVFINNLSIIAIFNSFVVLHNYTRDLTKLKKYSIFLFVISVLFACAQYYFLDNASTIDDKDKIAKVFLGLSGLSNAVLLALLIGKLDSKNIDAPAEILMLLYLYAAIQPFIIFFYGENPEIKIYTLYAALVLKVLFFSFIMWVIKEFRIRIYFFLSESIDQNIKSESEEIVNASQSSPVVPEYVTERSST